MAKKPEIRDAIEKAVREFEANPNKFITLTKLLWDWDAAMCASGPQLLRIAVQMEERPLDIQTTRIVLKLLRIRYQQDSIEAKRKKAA